MAQEGPRPGPPGPYLTPGRAPAPQGATLAGTDTHMSDVDSEELDPPAAARAGAAPIRCWMCENCTSEDVKNFHSFLVERSHSVEPRAMAVHLHEHLTAQQALASVLEDAPPGLDEILTHIRKHVLHPSVRVAQILRNLLELADTLQELVVSRADDGTPLIDVRTVTVYLKVVSEIMQIYKTADMSKMLFADLDA